MKWLVFKLGVHCLKKSSNNLVNVSRKNQVFDIRSLIVSQLKIYKTQKVHIFFPGER